MNGLPYYKAYPRDFIEGTIGMPFELKGAYRLILDLIYMQGGQLPDDARYISGLLGCSVRAWNKWREQLLDLGKIQTENGFISNFRASLELESLAKLQDKQRENRTRPNKNKEIQSPPSDQPEPEPDTEPERIGGGGSARAREADPSEREQILEAMGVGPDGVIGPSRFIGGQGDMAEVARWLALPGLTLPIVLEELRRVTATKADGPPKSFRYFTPAMQRLSGALTAPPLTPDTSAGPAQQTPAARHTVTFDLSKFDDFGNRIS